MSRLAETYLPQPYGGLPGHKEPTTALDAAMRMSPSAHQLRAEVLTVVTAAGVRGLTPDEAAKALGKSVLSIRPRFTELGPRHLGKIVKTGQRRPNDSGLMATVWRAS